MGASLGVLEEVPGRRGVGFYLARLHAAVCAVAREQTKPDIDRFRAGKTGEVGLLPRK